MKRKNGNVFPIEKKDPNGISSLIKKKKKVVAALVVFQRGRVVCRRKPQEITVV
jgi:hypothetical protein